MMAMEKKTKRKRGQECEFVNWDNDKLAFQIFFFIFFLSNPNGCFFFSLLSFFGHAPRSKLQTWAMNNSAVCVLVEKFIAMLVCRFYIYPFSFKCLCDHIMFGQIDQLLSFSLSIVLSFPDSGCFNWKIFIA